MRYKRFFSLLAELLFLFSALLSQQRFDTLSIESIARGIRFFHFQTSLPQQIYVAEIQLQEPSLRIESIRHRGLEKTSDAVRLRSSGKQTSVVAINGDFFASTDSFPTNNQVSNAIPVSGYTTPEKSQFACTGNRKIMMEGFTFSGNIRTRSKREYHFDRLNSIRTLSEITFYTQFRGTSTKTKAGGLEIILHPLENIVRTGDTLRYVVSSLSTAGNSPIPQNGAVISFGRSDTTAKFRSAFSIGDTIAVTLSYISSKSKQQATVSQLIGGWGRIVHQGIFSAEYNVTMEGLKESFINSRHPRTFAGINSDTTKLYLCVVDGRQANSIGMNFSEMAEFLRIFNVTEAVNLDGGGSSTMVIRGRVVNSPSDQSGERPVANSLHVISTSE